MCGLLFVQNSADYNCDTLVKSLSKCRHRGPDNTQNVVFENCFFGFSRLCITGNTEAGRQPLEKHGTILICNGQIFNYESLCTTHQIQLLNDVEVISDLIEVYDVFNQKKYDTLCNILDGDFAFVVMNKTGQLFAARDSNGIRPLFYGYSKFKKKLCFASELKCLLDICDQKTIKEFPPATYLYTDQNHVYISQYYSSIFIEPKGSFELGMLHYMISGTVQKRLYGDRQIGFFLSGGLNSSLIAALSTQLMRERVHTFAVGMDNNCEDIINARLVASHINSIHTEIIFTNEEALEILGQVIYQLESYDCECIQSAIPLYILSKYIKQNTNIKVILSGEGADELFGGYDMFSQIENPVTFHNETQNMLQTMHKFSLLKCERVTAAHGLQVRFPFCDKTLIEYVSQIEPALKQTKMRKYLIKKAFETENYLPHSILFRHKSSIVSEIWTNKIREIAESGISDEVFQAEVEVRKIFTTNIPQTKVELYYRRIYEKWFKSIDLGIK